MFDWVLDAPLNLFRNVSNYYFTLLAQFKDKLALVMIDSKLPEGVTDATQRVAAEKVREVLRPKDLPVKIVKKGFKCFTCLIRVSTREHRK